MKLMCLLLAASIVDSSLGEHLRHGTSSLKTQDTSSSNTDEDCYIDCRIVKIEALFDDEAEATEAAPSTSVPTFSPFYCHTGVEFEQQPYTIRLPPSVVNEHGSKLESGRSRVCIPKHHVNETSQAIHIPDSFALDVRHTPESRNLQQEKFKGTLRLLAVRVVSHAGEQPEESLDLIEGTIFGTGNEAYATSVTSQYYDVSHGHLQFVPAVGTGITGGVMEVNVPVTISSSDVQTMIMSPTLSAVQSALGGVAISDVADHIIFCIPNDSLLQTSASWTAFTFLNEGYSVYQRTRCTRISTAMHELGHALGFRHSGKGTDEYGDISCYMGYTYNAIGLPVKSFNAFKYWQSGWIDSDRMATITPTSGSATFKRLVPTTEYRDASLLSSDAVLLSVDNLMYMKYNVANSYDSGLDYQSHDKVAIIEANSFDSESYIVAELAVGELFEYTAPGTSEIRYIKFCEAGTSPYNYAQVVVSVDGGDGSDVCEEDLVYAQSLFDTTAPLPSTSTSTPLYTTTTTSAPLYTTSTASTFPPLASTSTSSTSSNNIIQGPTLFAGASPSLSQGSDKTPSFLSGGLSSFSSMFTDNSPVFFRLTHNGNE